MKLKAKATDILRLSRHTYPFTKWAVWKRKAANQINKNTIDQATLVMEGKLWGCDGLLECLM